MQRVRAGCPNEDLKDEETLTEGQWVVRRKNPHMETQVGQTVISILILPIGIPLKALEGTERQWEAEEVHLIDHF